MSKAQTQGGDGVGAALPHDVQRWLLAWARATIDAAVLAGGMQQEPSSAPPGAPAEVEGLAGCFVTIHTADHDLRGCIGTFVADRPLWLQVFHMAQAAAFEDPRFAALTSNDWQGCVLEISVLSEREPITGAEDVVIGEHGLWIQGAGRSGVLLPQVATEYGWDAVTFLEHTCLKAGLPTTAWRVPGMGLFRFGAQVFGER